MTIYIVMRGENSEGGSINGVFTERAAALSKLDEVTSSRSFVGCDWAKLITYKGDDSQLEVAECIDRHG